VPQTEEDDLMDTRTVILLTPIGVFLAAAIVWIWVNKL